MEDDRLKMSDYLGQLRQLVANNVRFYRHRLGLSQELFADQIGLHVNTVYLLESTAKPYNVPLRVLGTVAHALDLPVSALLEPRGVQFNPRGVGAAQFLRRQQELFHEQTGHQV
jgi:transcriptional regulator with XRE-family HTH domain